MQKQSMTHGQKQDEALMRCETVADRWTDFRDALNPEERAALNRQGVDILTQQIVPSALADDVIVTQLNTNEFRPVIQTMLAQLHKALKESSTAKTVSAKKANIKASSTTAPHLPHHVPKSSTKQSDDARRPVGFSNLKATSTLSSSPYLPSASVRPLSNLTSATVLPCTNLKTISITSRKPATTSSASTSESCGTISSNSKKAATPISLSAALNPLLARLDSLEKQLASKKSDLKVCVNK